MGMALRANQVRIQESGVGTTRPTFRHRSRILLRGGATGWEWCREEIQESGFGMMGLGGLDANGADSRAYFRCGFRSLGFGGRDERMRGD